MSKDLIRYDLMVQDALKGVVRKVLGDAAKEGLPGEHHFYISFRTDFPGVRLSSRLREKYPQDMTIILQHQFWDLAVTEHGFDVGLSFSGVPERLSIPFDAVSGFFDPSVQFGLKFELGGEAEAAPAQTERPTRGAASEPALAPPKKPIEARAEAGRQRREAGEGRQARKAEAREGRPARRPREQRRGREPRRLPEEELAPQPQPHRQAAARAQRHPVDGHDVVPASELEAAGLHHACQHHDGFLQREG